MSLCYFLKLLSEISLYFVIANGILSIALMESSNLLPMVICALVGGIAYAMDDKYRKYRFAVLPLLLAVFLFADSLAGAFILALPALFVGLCVVDRRYYIEHETFSDFFRLGMYIGAFGAAVVGLVLGQTSVFSYIVVFLCSGIMALNLLRQDSEVFKQTKFRLLNLAAIAGVLLIALLISSDVFLGTVGAILDAIWSVLLKPVFYVLSVFGYGAIYLIYNFFSLFRHNSTKELNTSSIQEAEKMAKDLIVDSGGNSPFVTFLLGVLVILALALLILYFMNTRKGRNKRSKDEVREIRRHVSNFRPEEKVPSDLFPPREPRAAVRYYYRSFLRLCLKTGQEFPSHYNSQWIENSVSDKFREEHLKKMRATYIRARYSKHSVTKEDVSTMKKQVKALQEDANELLGNALRTPSQRQVILETRLSRSTPDTIGKGPDSNMRVNDWSSYK